MVFRSFMLWEYVSDITVGDLLFLCHFVGFLVWVVILVVSGLLVAYLFRVFFVL